MNRLLSILACSAVVSTAAFAQSAAVMTSPSAGSVLTSPAQTFRWSSGTGVTEYALWLGSVTNGYDLLAVATQTNRQRAATVPINGGRIYARVWSLIAGQWQSNDVVYLTTNQSAHWSSMDYRAPGLTYTDPTMPNSNTDYTLLWRYIRQVRAELKGFATNVHDAAGHHPSNSIFGVDIADGALTNGAQYQRWDVAYSPAAMLPEVETNIVYTWTNWGAVSTDGTSVSATALDDVYRWRNNGSGIVSVYSPGSGYVNSEAVTLPGAGEELTSFATIVEDGVVIGLQITNIRGAYEAEPTGVIGITGGSGMGLEVDVTGCYESFLWRGAFSNLTVGTQVRVRNLDTGAAWTNSIVSLPAPYSSFTGSNAVGFTGGNCQLEFLVSATTNAVGHPTWTNATASWPTETYKADVTNAFERTLILAPDGMKLWLKWVTWTYAYNANEFHNLNHLYPPWSDVGWFNPPMSNVFALAAFPMATGPMEIGTNAGSVWIGGERLMMLPVGIVARDDPGRPTTNSFKVRQWFGQPVSYLVDGNQNGSLYGTGGVVVVVVGR